MAIPVPKATPDDDDFLNDLSDQDDWDNDEAADDEDPAPARSSRKTKSRSTPPPLPSSKPRSKVTSKKKKGGSGPPPSNSLVGIAIGAGGLMIVGLLAFFLSPRSTNVTQTTSANPSAVPAVSSVSASATGQAAEPSVPEAPANWVSFTVPTTQISIKFPQQPVPTPGEDGKPGVHAFSVKNPEYTLAVTTIDLPKASAINMLLDPQITANVLQGTISSITKKSESLSPAPVRYLETALAPGFEITLQRAGAKRLFRIFYLAKHITTVEFADVGRTDSTSVRDHFFASLRDENNRRLCTENFQQLIGTVPDTSPSFVKVPGFSGKRLSEARQRLKTRLVKQLQNSDPAPDPPADIATKVYYDSPIGRLPAYMTKIAKEGPPKPAIIWISGGEYWGIQEGFHVPKPANNDQSASAFWREGIVTMYPALRGGNENIGFKEGYLGEVDDILAARDFLAKQPGIDPNRIYLGGHSTGGTMVLLVAAATDKFRAVFSFGPSHTGLNYGPDFIPYDPDNFDETLPRLPIQWIGTVQSPVFVMEGFRDGNADSVYALQLAAARFGNDKAKFWVLPKANHFNILAPVTKLIVKKIQSDTGPTSNMAFTDADFNLEFAQ